MTIRETRFVFVREFGSRHGELHRERAGFVKIVARAYLNNEGWLMYGGGGWLAPGRFSMKTAAPAKVSLPLARVITESMQQARLLLNERFNARPELNSRPRRQPRQHHSL